MPGSMSEFPTQDIFRQETGPFDEYNTIAISKMPLINSDIARLRLIYSKDAEWAYFSVICMW